MKLKLARKNVKTHKKHKYHMLLNNKWVMEKIKGEIKKIPRDKWTPNLWDSAKVILRGKLTAVQVHLKQKHFPTPSLCMHAQLLRSAVWLFVILSARLLCPWNFPGKNTGMGCHFLHPKSTLHLLEKE